MLEVIKKLLKNRKVVFLLAILRGNFGTFDLFLFAA